MEEIKFYTKWWFWLIVGFVFIIFITNTGSNEINSQELSICQNSLKISEEQRIDLSIAVDNYIYELNNYCTFDPYNVLCFGLGN